MTGINFRTLLIFACLNFILKMLIIDHMNLLTLSRQKDFGRGTVKDWERGQRKQNELQSNKRKKKLNNTSIFMQI